MRVVLTGGGTGGHIYPALAIGKGLADRMADTELCYIGTAKGLEGDIVPQAGIPFSKIDVEGLPRPFSYKTPFLVLKALKSVLQARQTLKSFKPDVVIGTGGYVCGPVVLAAVSLGIPTMIHEQNAFPGVTNKLLSRFVDRVCISFEDSLKYFPKKNKISLTGLPVRKEIILAEKLASLEALGMEDNKTTIVITGGSRGAKTINQAAVQIMKKLGTRNNVQFYHITGQSGYQDTLKLMADNGIIISGNQQIKVVPYLYQMEYALAAADIIIGRSGASFLSEVMVRGIPSILIPYPFAAENHQEFNARALEKQGAARVIPDRELNDEKIIKQIAEMIDCLPLRNEMAEAARKMGRKNALDEIVDLIVEMGKS